MLGPSKGVGKLESALALAVALALLSNFSSCIGTTLVVLSVACGRGFAGGACLPLGGTLGTALGTGTALTVALGAGTALGAGSTLGPNCVSPAGRLGGSVRGP